MSRQPNGRPKIYSAIDPKTGRERWHAYVHIGWRNGKPWRKHIERGTAAAVADAIDELQARVRQGGEGAVGKIETAGQWLQHYLEEIVKPTRPQTTYNAYKSMIYNHALPVIWDKRLAGTRNTFEPEHLDAVYNRMRRTGGRSGKGMADTSVVKMHHILSKAMAVAVRRGKTGRNVCLLIDTPTARKHKMVGYALDDARKLLAATRGDRMQARWLLGLVLGDRQGEALGLRWPQVRLADDQPTLQLVKQIQRYTWRHGCTDPKVCAASFCRRTRCGPSWQHGCDNPDGCRRNPRFCPHRQSHPCRRHTRPCPAPCPPGCDRHAARCPQRVDGGLVEVDLKTDRSERPQPLAPPLVTALELRRQAQMREAHARGELWDDQGLVFTQPDGGPVDPRRDYNAWHELGVKAGVPKRRLHAARHTAATLLIATGASIEEVQELLGHTDIRTARGYVDVAAKAKADAVTRYAETLLSGQIGHLLTATP